MKIQGVVNDAEDQFGAELIHPSDLIDLLLTLPDYSDVLCTTEYVPIDILDDAGTLVDRVQGRVILVAGKRYVQTMTAPEKSKTKHDAAAAMNG